MSDPNKNDSQASAYSAFLRRVYFFKDLCASEFDEIAALCFEERFEAGEVVFMEGAIADKFYIVMEGKVEVWKAYNLQAQSLLAVHGTGHFFGEMALIDELPRSATLVAREKTVALSILREDFQRLIRSNASISLSVMMSISLMLRSSNETFLADLRERNCKLEAAYADLKAAQEELLKAERLSAIGKFSSLILHDIRNPLAVMKAVTDLMSLHVEDSVAVSSDLRRLRGEIARMERLAQEFLDYSRGEIRLALSATTVEPLFARLMEVLGDRMQRYGIDFVLENETTEPFMADTDRLSRVLLNLAENARNAMSKGGRLLISAKKIEDRIIFQVKDDGEGMTDEVRSRIFEPFYSNSMKGGTGLGLLIVKNVIEAHEGDIEVESEPGKGTLITISLPARL